VCPLLVSCRSSLFGKYNRNRNVTGRPRKVVKISQSYCFKWSHIIRKSYAPNYASNGATASTQSVFTYRVNGRFYTSFAASTNLYVTKVGIAQPVSTYCYYLFTINSSGVVTVTKGRHAASTAGAAYPAAPSGGAIFGGVLIKTSAATAFTMGTSPFTPTYLPGGYPIWYQINSVYNEPGFAVLP
jgi:hypothetical protein